MLYPVLQDPLHPIVSSLFDRPRGASIGQMLFGAGEQGGWYDVSDMSTLFQDAAGTTPVTAVEQPVGLMLDKSGRGNHATQATTTKRPVLSRRVNLLTKTEDFEDAAWVRDAGTVTPNAYTSPTGRVFAKYTPDGTNVGNHRVRQAVTLPTVAHTLSFEVKAAGYTGIKLRATTAWVNFDLTTETVGNSLNVSSPTIVAIGDGVYRVSGTFSVGAVNAYIYVDPNNTVSSDTSAFAGDGTSGIYISAASITLATDAHLSYQWVNTATDYDADPAKFPAYLRFDGVDDALQTGNIDFTSTDKMTVWAGVTKLSDAVTGTVVELSASKNANNGVFALFAPLTVGAPDIAWYSKGTNERLAASTSESAPVTRVITGEGNISGDISSLRVNGAVVQTETSDQGPGNFGNYPLYIGARSGTSLYFNGRLYSIIVRGDQSSLSQIEATELYIKQKMRLP